MSKVVNLVVTKGGQPERLDNLASKRKRPLRVLDKADTSLGCEVMTPAPLGSRRHVNLLGEVRPIDSPGLRGLTIMLIMAGYAAVLYTVGGFMQIDIPQLSEKRSPRSKTMIDRGVAVPG